MRLIKRVDLYLLKGYLQLFAGTFFICLFVLVIQFTAVVVKDFIGKGLTFDVMSQYLWYLSLTLVPTALPLAVLLAALITFGNLGERLELLSMKAAGISLLRILRPIFVFVLLVCGASFYFQNVVSPDATAQLAALTNSMKHKSPELEIPEGTFYNIPKTAYNFYVERKDMQTGMLYGIMIYDTRNGYTDMQIVLADSGRLQSTADNLYLKLTLYGGERFQNLKSSNNGGTIMKASEPYMRETFLKEETLIDFDSNFEVQDTSYYKYDARTKDIWTIEKGIEAIRKDINNAGHNIYSGFTCMSGRLSRNLPIGRSDSTAIVAEIQKLEPWDSVVAHLSEEVKQDIWNDCKLTTSSMLSQCEYNAEHETDGKQKSLRLHYLEWHRKYAVTIACLIFFLIGGPLGSIIRKGGLGLPVVVSVLIFIFYYIFDNSSTKMAKAGTLSPLLGAWTSTMVLAPLALFLTYKANRDSGVFNMDAYRLFFRRLFGMRESRNLNRKEIIIYECDYAATSPRLTALVQQCEAYSSRHRLWKLPSYLRLYFHYKDDRVVQQLSDELEDVVETLHNSSHSSIIGLLNQLPILVPNAHTRPFRSKRLNMIVGILLPVGLFFYFRIWRYRIRLHRDLSAIQHQLGYINERIQKYIQEEPTQELTLNTQTENEQ